MIIKKNIWTAFYLIIIGGFFLFTSLSYLKYKDIREEYHSKYRNLTEIIGHSSRAMFDQAELMLEVLGMQLLEDKRYEDTQKSRKMFDELLDKNPALAGFGLVGVDGAFLMTSSNIDPSKMPNLLQDSVTKHTFQEALLSKDMVLGRTYYINFFDQWVIPLRKSIRDKNGTVIGVMTTGLRVNDSKGFLQNLHMERENSGIVLIKDFDKDQKMYRLFSSDISFTTKETMYKTPVLDQVYRAVDGHVQEKYGLSLKALKSSGRIISIELKDAWGQKRIAGFMYDKKYKLWILFQSEISVVWESFYKIFLIYVLVFLLSLAIVYTLFRYIAKAEKIKKDELLFQVTHDTLTGLLNRSYLYKHKDEWIGKSSNCFNILFIDLDNFKNINDVFGHTIGDKVLIEVSQRLSSFFNENDLLLRQGGDEFIVLKNCSDAGGEEQLLESLINTISLPYNIDNMALNLGVSIGVAQYPKDAQELDALLSLAEITMYEAKKRKNTFALFSSEMRVMRNHKADIEQELRNAIKNDELWMVYQPQLYADGRFHGVEALVRWKNEKLGCVPPDQFIGVAEEAGLIPQLGAFILKRSLEEIKALQTEMNMSFRLSINASVRQLMEVDFLNHFSDKIEACGMDKSLVTLEITESLFIEELDYILPLLLKIREKGIKLSLDDFGTGYSSLSMLRALPIDELKIDKSFVDEVLNIKEDRAMVQSVIAMGKNLSMETLAEGVETKEQADMLSAFGCELFQGYYFSEPLDKDELQLYLERGSFTVTGKKIRV